MIFCEIEIFGLRTESVFVTVKLVLVSSAGAMPLGAGALNSKGNMARPRHWSVRPSVELLTT